MITPEKMQMLQSLLPILIPVILLELGLMVGALIHLLKRGKVKVFKVWIWVLLIVCFQIIGPVLYFLIGREDA